MYAERSHPEVRRLARRLYAEQRDHLTRTAQFNATSEADAEEALQEAFASFIARFDPGSGAPPVAWLTLTLKRQCWRQRRQAHLDRYAGQEAGRGGEEAGSFLDALASREADLAERVAERDEARRRLARLKAEQRTALGLLAAGYSYREIAAYKRWTYTKVNRCIAEGRAALRRGVAR